MVYVSKRFVLQT